PQKRPRKLRTDELLALFWKRIKNPTDGRWRIVGVHRSNHEVPGFRRRDRSFDRLRIPHLADKNNVGILSQCVLEGRRKIARIGTNLALVHQTAPLRVNKFDRVLNTDDVNGTPPSYR